MTIDHDDKDKVERHIGMPTSAATRLAFITVPTLGAFVGTGQEYLSLRDREAGAVGA